MPVIQTCNYHRVDKDTIEIIFPNGERISHDENSLCLIVSNIRRSVNQYATVEAYRKDLSIYDGALSFLRAKGGG